MTAALFNVTLDHIWTDNISTITFLVCWKTLYTSTQKHKQLSLNDEHSGYLQGRCVCHPLPYYSRCGFGQNTSGGLRLDTLMGLAEGQDFTHSWFSICSTCWDKRQRHRGVMMVKFGSWWVTTTLVPVVVTVICWLGRCAILFLSPEKLWPELWAAALAEAESWTACCCASCIRW